MPKQADNELEDIEAFLREQEGDDYVPPSEPHDETPSTSSSLPPTAKHSPLTEQSDQWHPEAVTVEVEQEELIKTKKYKKPKDLEHPKGEVEVVSGPDPRTVRKEGSSIAKNIEGTGSKRLSFLLRLILLGLYLTPIFIGTWLFGSLIGSWIATSWILAIVALLVVILPGLILRLIVKKGRFSWWISGLALVGILATGFALPTLTAESIVRHGHWILTSIITPLGASPDNFATRTLNTFDRWIAGTIGSPSPDVFPSSLGTSNPLGSTPTPPEPPPSEPTTPAAPAAPSPGSPESPESPDAKAAPPPNP